MLRNFNLVAHFLEESLGLRQFLYLKARLVNIIDEMD